MASEFVFKIVIVGNSSVGKSSLIKRFVDDDFSESYLATIGVDFRFKYPSPLIKDSDCRWGISQTPSMGHGRTGEVQDYYQCLLQRGAGSVCGL